MTAPISRKSTPGPQIAIAVSKQSLVTCSSTIANVYKFQDLHSLKELVTTLDSVQSNNKKRHVPKNFHQTSYKGDQRVLKCMSYLILINT